MPKERIRGILGAAVLAALLAGCSDDGEASGDGSGGTGGSGAGGSSGTGAGGTGGPAEDFEAMADDFECLTDWDRVRRFRITNKLGHLDEALAVAESPDGGRYPPGTIIQLVPFEAMVKRGAGYNTASNDWEFFELSVSAAGTTIVKRGTEDVVNQFGGNCFDCHSQAEPQWDFVCEQDRGCTPLPLDENLILALQEGDARCQ